MIRIILGPPCAGKSTFVRENAKPGDVTIDWDRMCAGLEPNGQIGEHTNRETPVMRLASYARVALGAHVRDKWDALTDEGREVTAWIPLSSTKTLALDKYITAGARITLLDPGLDECISRAEKDNRPEGTIEAIEKWYADPPQIPDAWLYEEKETSTMRAKNFNIQVKAAGGEKTANPFGGDLLDGDFIAYASTFNDEPDSYGDVVFPGAFTKSLETWRANGAFDVDGEGSRLPLLFGHRMDDPAFNIGHIVEAKEDEHGLLVWGRIDLDSEKGQAAHRLVKSRRLNQLSFAYDIIEADPHEKDAGLDLKELDLFEVSLVQLGANRNTSVLAVKAAAETVSSTKGEFTDEELDELMDARENLREALEHIEFILTSSKPDEERREQPREGDGGESDFAASDKPASAEADAKADTAAALLALTIAITKSKAAQAAEL